MRMMRYILVSFLFLTAAEQFFAQTNAVLLFHNDSLFREKHAYLEVSGLGAFGSDLIHNGFMEKMYLGGHIADETIDELVGNASEQNRAGLDAKISMQWWDLSSGLFNDPCLQMTVGISTENHGYVGFSQNMFSLLFRGNTAWAGEKRELGPFYAGYQAFQKFSVGIVNQRTYSQYRLSFVSGQDYTSIHLRDASIYTTSALDSIQLSYEGEMYRADPDKKGFGSGKGLGAAFDMDWNIPMKDNKGWFGISAYNIGFIKWNGQTENYTLDSTFTWTGFDIGDLFDLDEDLSLPNLEDTIGYTMEQKSRWIALPLDIRVRMLRKLNDVFFVDAGIAVQPYQLSLPELRLAFGQDLKCGWQFTEQVLFGGYSGFRLGAGVRSTALKNFIFHLGSENILGWMGEDFRGRDISLAISRIF